MKLLNQFLIEI